MQVFKERQEIRGRSLFLPLPDHWQEFPAIGKVLRRPGILPKRRENFPDDREKIPRTGKAFSMFGEDSRRLEKFPGGRESSPDGSGDFPMIRKNS